VREEDSIPIAVNSCGVSHNKGVLSIACRQCKVVTGPKHEKGEESSHAMRVP
jgi:hypothetical protein